MDLDNDGDQDLAVAIMGGLVVASNELDHFVVRDVLTTNDDTTSLNGPSRAESIFGTGSTDDSIVDPSIDVVDPSLSDEPF